MSEETAYETIQWREIPSDDGRFTWETTVDGIVVRATETLEDGEAQAYVNRACKLFDGVKRVNVEVDGDDALISYDLAQGNFERIRRITGYLVGTLDRFNDAKRAEESERVKHDVGGCGCSCGC